MHWFIEMCTNWRKDMWNGLFKWNLRHMPDRWHTYLFIKDYILRGHIFLHVIRKKIRYYATLEIKIYPFSFFSKWSLFSCDIINFTGFWLGMTKKEPGFLSARWIDIRSCLVLVCGLVWWIKFPSTGWWWYFLSSV